MRRIVLRAMCWKSTSAFVVISPASTTRLSFTSVSAATRERGSWARIASSTASEIWSATLSGCPSDTDSEVNKNSLIVVYPPGARRFMEGRKDTKLLHRFFTVLLKLSARLPLRFLHGVGSVLGWTIYGISPKYRRQLKANLAQAGYLDRALRHEAIASA